MDKLAVVLQQFIREEDGAAAVEYGLLIALIAAVIIVTVQVLGTSLNTAYCTITKAFGGAC
jgi:pilus assembly protein Flp/PilA